MKRWLLFCLPLLLISARTDAQDEFPAQHRGFVGARGYVVPPGSPPGTIPPWRRYQGSGFLFDPEEELDPGARLITREEYDVHVEEWLAAKEAYESETGHTTQRVEPGALAAYPCLDAEGELSTFGSGPTKAGTRSVLVASR
ncbi:MAG: hypothetical protein KC668_30310, partial [Myxococcales bacterium]|nr:hypothetical protein [Myxococcales bacterium]